MKKLKDISRSLSPLDVSTILYMLISGIYMLWGYNQVDNIGWHLFIRGSVLLLLTVFIIAEKNVEQPLVKSNITLARNIYPFFLLNFFYSETSYLKNIVFNKDVDSYIATIEQHLWSMQPSLEFSRHLNMLWFKELMYFCYFSFYLMIPVVCLSIYFKHKQNAERPLFIVIFSFYLFYLFYDLVPVLGPQYYYHTYGTEGEPVYLFGKIMRYLQLNVERPTGAFPSSHVGMALALCYLAYHYNKRMFYYVLPFLIGICFATVYLKEHYLVDVVAGLAAAPLFMYISGKVYPKMTLLIEKSEEDNSLEENIPQSNDEEVSPIIIK